MAILCRAWAMQATGFSERNKGTNGSAIYDRRSGVMATSFFMRESKMKGRERPLCGGADAGLGAASFSAFQAWKL